MYLYQLQHRIVKQYLRIKCYKLNIKCREVNKGKGNNTRLLSVYCNLFFRDLRINQINESSGSNSCSNNSHKQSFDISSERLISVYISDYLIYLDITECLICPDLISDITEYFISVVLSIGILICIIFNVIPTIKTTCRSFFLIYSQQSFGYYYFHQKQY